MQSILRHLPNRTAFGRVPTLNMADPQVQRLLRQVYRQQFEDPAEDRAVGSLLGLVVGDALGAPVEFQLLQYGTRRIHGFDRQETACQESNMKAGQWTDDGSMALCLCDSLLASRGSFDPIDSMLRYLGWWYHGDNNAFQLDAERSDKTSVGLGGNISLSFQSFLKHGDAYTRAGNAQTSGNGSLMRLAPVAIAHHRDLHATAQVARASSFVTHQGHEAAECCASLALLLALGIRSGDRSIFNGDLSQALSSFWSCPVASVRCLLKSQAENGDPDRNWNWKHSHYRYSPTRSAQNPGYVGSYAMDALAMALHCFYTTRDFASCVLKAANLGGDADTVAAIAGQLAGAYYGASAIPLAWIEAVQRWDAGGTIAFRASRLYRRRHN